ncbi:sequence-specific DNA binding protein [Apiospora marii]|uniref:sequence-specific DNA binding protein n=1 Tax=Apiospora marii TaxID=335849 RepID=UPI003132446F
MNAGLCDGMPVNYTSSPTSDSTGNPKRLCTTQSPDGDLPNLDSFYTPSPTLDAAETVQQHQHPSHILPTLNTAAAIQTYPQIHSASSSTPSMLATPPNTAGVDHEEYTYQGSPGSCGAAHVPALSARSSDTSPRSWSSPDLQQLNYPPGYYQISSKGHHDFPPPYGGSQPAIATEDAFSVSAAAQPSMEGCGGAYAVSVSDSPLPGDIKHDPDTIMGQDAPDMTPDHTDSVMSADSPLPKHEYSSNSSYPYDEGVGLVAGDIPHPHHGVPEEDELAKGDEPYAKLIEKAFLSKDSRSMTLQELYQWFRDNTERGRSETKGWQNSIRHNLSMNKAFEKRERRHPAGGPTTESGEPRRSNEWVLTNWAERDGVQSTTRYRKSNSTSGRRGPSSRSHHQQGSISARAASGRKGGLTASKTKAANNRALLKRQSMGIVPQHHHYHGAGSSSSYQHGQRHHSIAFYQQQQQSRMHHHDYLHGGRHHLPEPDYTRSIVHHHHDESESSEGSSLLQYAGHHPMTSSMAASIGSGSGYYQAQPYLASQASQQQHPYSHQHHPNHPHDAYSHQPQPHAAHPFHPRPESHFKVEHATSVYEPPVTSSPSSAAIHGVYASVFANEIGEGTPENPVRPATLPYRTSGSGWAESAQS